jgi:hypothetical protein
MKQPKIGWLPEPEAHDYPAALSYLSLLFDAPTAAGKVRRLKKARPSTFKAKDIARASGLSVLGISNANVDRDRKKIREGRRLSPLLLVRDSANGRLIVADGYHRMCAVYSYDEDAVVPCRIV